MTRMKVSPPSKSTLFITKRRTAGISSHKKKSRRGKKHPFVLIYFTKEFYDKRMRIHTLIHIYRRRSWDLICLKRINEPLIFYHGHIRVQKWKGATRLSTLITLTGGVKYERLITLFSFLLASSWASAESCSHKAPCIDALGRRCPDEKGPFAPSRRRCNNADHWKCARLKRPRPQGLMVGIYNSYSLS